MSKQGERTEAGALSRRDFLERATGLAGLVATGWPAESRAPGRPPARQEARGEARGEKWVLENGVIQGEWEIGAWGVRLSGVTDLRSGRKLEAPPAAWVLTLGDGKRIEATRVKRRGEPRIQRIEAQPRAGRLAERVPGRRIAATFVDPAEGLEIGWRAILRDGSRYLRQEIEIRATRGPVLIREIEMMNVALAGAAVAGTVKGSPLTAGNWYFGFEYPLAESAGEAGKARAFLRRVLPLEAGHTAAYSSVIGAADDGQMRRQFREYVERERAHPYRTFLHYNSWYDLGYFTAYTAEEALGAIRGMGEKLHVERGVKLNSFLFDDGWDDHEMWGFNSGFPHGFTPLRQAAARYGAAPGAWLSPWGGYGKPRQQRIAWAMAHGYETDSDGLALAGPKYFAKFLEVSENFIRHDGVNQFKFDGTGSAATTVPGSGFDSDFDAAIRLIEDLRALEPALYVNLTTGTYPSPFWLRWADSTWRGGEDHSFAGVGSQRQRWITYRDAATFAHVVRRGPLYPLNSLMLHGLIYARYAEGLSSDPQGDFGDEIRSYFGTGTQLQEMYVTHELLSRQDWDHLAEAANWSRRNAQTLVDTHWVGGDPGQLEPYGWAAWSPAKAILTLRNPADRPQAIALDPGEILQLPAGAPGEWLAIRPWKQDAGKAGMRLEAGKRQEFRLAPFEVLTLEAEQEGSETSR